MSNTILSELILKLDNDSHKLMERCVVYAAQENNPTVELEHLLFILATECTYGQLIFSESNIDSELLLKKIQKKFNQIVEPLSTTPSLSVDIVTLLKESWLQASIENDDANISVLDILLTLTLCSTLRSKLSHYIKPIDKLQKVTKRLLKTKKTSLIADSSTDKLNDLRQFTINLNHKAAQGKLSVAIGRENEINKIINILQRKKQNNPILIGEPGVGKTAIIEGLALRIHEHNVPKILEDTLILSLDMASLLSGASVKGEFERRLKSLTEQIQQLSQPAILFIDEAHTLIGSGNSSGGLDTANLLKPALARGELRTIAATTVREYKLYLEKDGALTRRFQPIYIDEPSDEQTIAMLRALQSGFEEHHRVIIKDDALRAAVHLSKRYLCDRFLPDKAISLIDTACAKNALQKQASPLMLSELNNEKNTLQKQLIQYNKNKLIERRPTYEKQLKSRLDMVNKKINRITQEHEKERKLIDEIENCLRKAGNEYPKKTFHQLSRKLQTLHKKHCHIPFVVNRDAIAQVITEWTGIPIERLTDDMSKKIELLSQELKTQIIQQNHATDIILQAMIKSMLKIRDSSKPIGVFLFTGPSGVGKTHTALTLADLFFGTRQHVTTLNMSEYKEPHKVSLLLGSPPGYVGYGEGGILTEAVRRQPYHLVLIDEIEKAHPDIHEVFYQIFDTGKAQDSQGNEVNFRNTIFIITSNLASKEIIENQDIPDELLSPRIQDALLENFKPAFLGRLTIVPFKPLSNDSAKTIIERKLRAISDTIASNHNERIEFNESIVQQLLDSSDYTLTGAREFDRVIEQRITPMITKQLLGKYRSHNST